VEPHGGSTACRTDVFVNSHEKRSVGTFWAGPPLGPFENACLTSFARAGHHVQLFSFDRDVLVPPGVEWCDASEVLSESSLIEITRESGGYATFADLFRYRLLQLSDLVWVDTDVLCLDNEFPDGPYLFGYEYSRFVNNAVLAAPRDSDFLSYLVDTSRAADVRHVAWGELGPRLVTDGVARYGLGGLIQPMETFYPINSDELWMLFDPAAREQVEELVDGSATLHLWNEILRRRGAPVKQIAPPKGSWLRQMFDDLGISFPTHVEHDVEWICETLGKDPHGSAARQEAVLVERSSALGQRDAALRERDAALRERDTALEERDVALGERDAALEERNAADAARLAIERSRTWRSMSWYRSLRSLPRTDRDGTWRS
jgi:hypothetical protein